MKFFLKYIGAALILTISVYVLLHLVPSPFVENDGVVFFLIIVAAIFYYKLRHSLRLKETYVPIQFIDA